MRCVFSGARNLQFSQLRTRRGAARSRVLICASYSLLKQTQNQSSQLFGGHRLHCLIVLHHLLHHHLHHVHASFHHCVVLHHVATCHGAFFAAFLAAHHHAAVLASAHHHRTAHAAHRLHVFLHGLHVLLHLGHVFVHVHAHPRLVVRVLVLR